MRWSAHCAVLGMLAIGCAGNPVEASPISASDDGPASSGETTTSISPTTGDVDEVPETGVGSSGEALDDESSEASGADSTGSPAASCGDALAEAGEWCWRTPEVVTGVLGVSTFALGSIDDDADLEIVVVDVQGSPLLVELGGAGWMVLAVNGLPLAINTLAIVDLDGDGFGDVVAGTPTSQLHIAYGTSDALIAGAAVGAYTPLGLLAPLDLDKDGVVDLAHASATSSEIDFYHAGSGNLVYWTYAFGSATSYTDVAIADVDGDGFRDLVAVGLAGAIDVIAASANGYPSVVTTDVPDGVGAIALGDLDGDSWADAVHLVADTTQVSLLRGGAGGWENPVQFPLTSPASDIAIADLDRDGDLDLVVAGGQQLVMLENLGKAALSEHAPIDLGLPAKRLAVADLDADGVPEVITSGATGLEVARGNP